MKLSKSVPALVGGSAVAAFGFSLGRDIYKGTKNAALLILALLLVVLPLVGVYYGALWIGRNYRGVAEGLAWRLAGVLIVAAAVIVGYVPHSMAVDLFLDVTGLRQQTPSQVPAFVVDADLTVLNFISYLIGFRNETEPLLGEQVAFWRTVLVVLLAAMGFSRGVFQRRTRRMVWEAQEHNARFMQEVGLRELANGEFEDAEGADSDVIRPGIPT